MPTPIRFKGIVGTTAQIATDRFQGRIAFDTTLARFVVFFDATNYATMARRDVLETFAAGINDSTLTAGRVMYAGTSGRHSGSAKLTVLTAGVANLLIGDGVVAETSGLTLDAPAGNDTVLSFRSANVSRWGLGRMATSLDFAIIARTSVGTEIDRPFIALNASAGLITIGGSTNRPVNFTGAIQTTGVQRISAAGAASFTTLSTTGLATLAQATVSDLTTGRMVSTTTAGRLQALDAAASRALIGAASSAGSVAYATLFTGRRTVSCTNGVMATLIPSYTVAANGWTVGMRLVFEVNFFTARDGQFEVKLGGNLIASYGLGTVTRSIFRIELVCLSTGATARFAYAASVYDPSTSTATTQTIIGDSQANVDGVGDNWYVDTTASTSIAFEYTATAGTSPGNVVIHSGSVQISTP